MEYFIKERIERNPDIPPQRIAIYKELPKAEDCPKPNHLNSKKAAYSLP
jgi:hypothetical protein